MGKLNPAYTQAAKDLEIDEFEYMNVIKYLRDHRHHPTVKRDPVRCVAVVFSWDDLGKIRRIVKSAQNQV